MKYYSKEKDRLNVLCDSHFYEFTCTCMGFNIANIRIFARKRDLRLALICHKKKMKFKSKRFILFGDIKIKQWVANILTNQNSPEKFCK